jgi:hypothetical protein
MSASIGCERQQSVDMACTLVSFATRSLGIEFLSRPSNVQLACFNTLVLISSLHDRLKF